MASSSSPEARKFDVLGDDLDGTIVYRCICYGQEKLAKYKAMKRWLEEIGDEQMQTTLDRFHWTFEMSTWEKALQMADERWAEGLARCMWKERSQEERKEQLEKNMS